MKNIKNVQKNLYLLRYFKGHIQPTCVCKECHRIEGWNSCFTKWAAYEEAQHNKHTDEVIDELEKLKYKEDKEWMETNIVYPQRVNERIDLRIANLKAQRLKESK